MVIILYFPISGLMMDDGTGPVINKPPFRPRITTLGEAQVGAELLGAGAGARSEGLRV